MTAPRVGVGGEIPGKRERSCKISLSPPPVFYSARRTFSMWIRLFVQHVTCGVGVEKGGWGTLDLLHVYRYCNHYFGLVMF